MPPKKKPVQAGKFKPLKRPTKKATAAEPSASTNNAAAATSSSSNDAKPRSTTTSTASKPSNNNSRSRSPKGRGGGRGSSGRGGGRGGRGRGGRGGRFIAPTGQAFFTGNASAGGGTTNNASAAAAGTRAARGGGGPIDPTRLSSATGPTAQKYTVTREAAKSAAAAARAREGEGEEIVVMEMDLEEDDDDEGGKKKKSVLEQDRPEREGPSLYDDEVQETTVDIDAYEYDSDSSIEEEKQRRKGNVSHFRMAPNQLPFPVAPHQQSMYDCQGATNKSSLIADEKKSADVEMATEQQSSFTLSDPVLESPFIDVNKASESLKQLELDSWFLMKFPTRLPHLDNSGSGGLKANVKSEMSEGDEPDFVGSSSNDVTDITPATVSVGAGPSTATGYDDTLKDIPPGRYGRIVVRKSGRTELIVGGGDSGEPEVRMLVHEGLQCGFRQEAVSIDPDESTFVTLGNVNKSIVVTPDIEKAFASS